MKSLPFTLRDQKLLKEALTHRSFINEHKTSGSHNERLEFLGDAVLELAVSQFLFNKFPEKKEGELTSLRAALVRTSTLAEIAQELDLGQRLHLSKGEEVSGGRTNPTLLANTVEACLGALYLDQGFPAVVSLLTTLLFPKIDAIIQKKLFKDYKSTLQEVVQASGLPSPVYIVLGETGPDHDKQFTVGVLINTNQIAAGKGKSKQAAQQEAARLALEKHQVS